MAKALSKHSRPVRKIREIIDRFGVDLNGEVVLTEVGSGNYLYTPIIPALAGAKKVYAWCRDSRFGKAEDIFSQCGEILKELGLESQVVFYKGRLNEAQLAEASIVTNSGFTRPLDAEKISHMTEGAAIPLMYEAWEFREGEIDLPLAKSKGIKVAGTWEDHPNLQVFQYIGPLATKLALQAGYEVRENNIFIWSDDDFGEVAREAFKTFGAASVHKSIDADLLLEKAPSLDFIFLCDYSETRDYQEVWPIDQLSKANPALGLVHLYGQFNRAAFSTSFETIFPEKDGLAQVMSETLSHVGIQPLINLTTAGLKVGELMRKGVKDELAQPMNYV